MGWDLSKGPTLKLTLLKQRLTNKSKEVNKRKQSARSAVSDTARAYTSQKAASYELEADA